MASETTVIGIVVLASAVNVSGTFIKGAQDYKKDPMTPVLAGFVIGALLLGLYGAVPKVAVALGAAFLITSTLENGKPVIDVVSNIVNNGGKTS